MNFNQYINDLSTNDDDTHSQAWVKSINQDVMYDDAINYEAVKYAESYEPMASSSELFGAKK